MPQPLAVTSAADVAKIVADFHAQLSALALQIHTLASSEALLHFGAIAFLVTVAYLGIDRLHGTNNVVGAESTKQAADIEEWLPTLEITIQTRADGGRSVTNPALVNRHAYVLLYICDIHIEKLGLKRIWYFLFRQGFVPGLNYFRKHRHLVWVSIFAILSGTALATLVASEIWDLPMRASGVLRAVMYWIFLVTLIVSFGSSIVHYVLNAVMGTQCLRLKGKVKVDVQKWKDWLAPPPSQPPPPPAGAAI